MGILETEALILRTYNLAEADKIVVCLTRNAGLVRAVAKGSRRLKNRFGAALEPFTLVSMIYYQKENRELASLRNAEILRSHFNLSCDAETLTGLAYMGDLVLEFSPPNQANEKLFRMLRACVEAIAESPADLPAVLRYFEVWLLKLEGFLPDIRRCAECHCVFETETVYMGSDLALRCRRCNQGTGSALSQRLHMQLRATEKVGPYVFAQESRGISAKTRREMAELTSQIIGRVLERQPRVQPVFQRTL